LFLIEIFRLSKSLSDKREIGIVLFIMEEQLDSNII
jgi:hypothetical protein